MSLGGECCSGMSPNICIIGAGPSGLLAGIKLRMELGLAFTIFEENEDIGGRWLSAYPGHCTASLSHLSAYSFELKPDWTETYASQKEMLGYLQGVARKYGIYPSIKFHSEVKSLTWELKTKKWSAIVLNKKLSTLKYYTFDQVIVAAGNHRVPVIPEKFQGFKGPILHTSQWDPTIDLEGKVVGVVGSGLPAVQLIPVIEPKVKTLHYFEQKQSWILPKIEFKYPKVFKKLLEKLHFVLVLFHWILFAANEIFCYPIILKNSLFHHFGNYTAKKLIWAETPKKNDCNLRHRLEPKYIFGYEPILYSHTFYKAMKSGRVVLHQEKITQVLEDSVKAADGIQHLDVLILAPEDDLHQFFGPLKIFDAHSQITSSASKVEACDLLHHWQTSRGRMRSYYGITTSATPNMFFLRGPHSTIIHNTSLAIVECQMNLIVKLLEEMLKRGSKFVAVEAHAEDVFMTDLEKQIKRTVWSAVQPGAWYANSKGAVSVVWPWSSIRYWCQTRSPDFGNFCFYN